MKTVLISLLASVLLIAPSGHIAAAQEDMQAGGGESYMVVLTGAAEVPGPGDADGMGMATLTINEVEGTICLDTADMNISLPVTGAHIHAAPAGAPGSIVVPFIGGGGSLPQATSSSFGGCVAIDADMLQAIEQNPENYYLNFHNADFPAGAIRGQLAE